MGKDGAPRSKKRSAKWKIARLLLLGLAISAVVFAAYAKQPKIIKQLDRSVYDMLLRGTAGGTAEKSLVIVDIDEPSLDKYGQWPWPRYILAKMIKQLTDYGVSAIGVDILMAESDRTSPDLLVERFKEDLNLDVTFDGIPVDLVNYDEYLTGVLKNSPVVTGFYVQTLKDGETPALPSELPKGPSIIPRATNEKAAEIAIPYDFYMAKAKTVTMPLKLFSDAVPIGFTNAEPDPDGIVRGVPLIIKVGNKVYPSLALAAFMKAKGIKNILPVVDSIGLHSILLSKDYNLPVNINGVFTVPFRGPRGMYTYYSAAGVLDGQYDAADFKNKIVFIGSTSVGLLDIRSTPFDQAYPGVEVHLAVLDAIMSNRTISRTPFYAHTVQAFAIFFAGIICALAFGLAKPSIYVPSGLVLIGSAIAASLWVFSNGVYISPAYVVLTIVVQAIVFLSLRFWQEESHKRFIKSAFGRYVAPEVVDSIAKRDDDFLGGQKRELTILFSDLRGFTTMSESLDPHQVVSLLDEYFTPMTAIVRATGGTLDKFIGDALMAFWNAPLDVPDHAKRAVSASLQMIEALKELNPMLKEKYGLTLKVGVGMHTGWVYVGNMGSEDMVNYTVIGDNVNLASRLEGLSKVYGQQVLVSEDTAKACAGGEWTFLHLDSLRVKGKHQAVNVYTPMSKKQYEECRDETELFIKARDMYFKGSFAESEEIFKKLHEANPGHQLYITYLERTAGLVLEPPAEWDGSWTFLTK